jgi:hypothetical protein
MNQGKIQGTKYSKTLKQKQNELVSNNNIDSGRIFIPVA